MQGETKGIIASKLNWVGVVAVLIALQDKITGVGLSEGAETILVAALGVAVVVLRTWFTSTSISGIR